MPHFRTIKAVEGGGNVEQRCQQILFDISDFAAAALQAIENVGDVVESQRAETLKYQLRRDLSTGDREVTAYKCS